MVARVACRLTRPSWAIEEANRRRGPLPRNDVSITKGETSGHGLSTRLSCPSLSHAPSVPMRPLFLLLLVPIDSESAVITGCDSEPRESAFPLFVIASHYKSDVKPVTPFTAVRAKLFSLLSFLQFRVSNDHLESSSLARRACVFPAIRVSPSSPAFTNYCSPFLFLLCRRTIFPSGRLLFSLPLFFLHFSVHRPRGFYDSEREKSHIFLQIMQ